MGRSQEEIERERREQASRARHEMRQRELRRQREPITALERELDTMPMGDDNLRDMATVIKTRTLEQEDERLALAKRSVRDQCQELSIPMPMAERVIEQADRPLRRRDMTAEQRAERRRLNAEKRIGQERERIQEAESEGDRRMADMRLKREEQRLERLKKKQGLEQERPQDERSMRREMAHSDRQIERNQILIAEAMRPIPWEQDRPLPIADIQALQRDDLWDDFRIHPLKQDQADALPMNATLRDLEQAGIFRPIQPERMLALDRDLDDVPLAPIACLEHEAKGLEWECDLYESRRETERPRGTGDLFDPMIMARSSDFLHRAMPTLLQPMERDKTADKAIVGMSREMAERLMERDMPDRERILEIARLLEGPAKPYGDQIHGNTRLVGSLIASLPKDMAWSDDACQAVGRHACLAIGIDPDRHRVAIWSHDNGKHIHALFCKVSNDGQLWLGEHTKTAIVIGRARWDHHGGGDPGKERAPSDKEMHESYQLAKQGRLYAKFRDLKTGQISALPLQDEAWMLRIGREAKPQGPAGIWAIKRSYGGREQAMLLQQIRHLSGCEGA